MTERRKTAHLTEQFREYVREMMSEITGLELKQEHAWIMFRKAYKAPMRFLLDLPESEVDSYGDKSVPIPGVGQFKIYRAKPKDGKQVGKGEEAYYPRFKFYPSNAIAAEVEKHFGVADEESERAFERSEKAEERYVEQASTQIPKAAGASGKDKSGIEEAIRKVVQEEIAKGMKGSVEEKVEEVKEKREEKPLKEEKVEEVKEKKEDVKETAKEAAKEFKKEARAESKKKEEKPLKEKKEELIKENAKEVKKEEKESSGGLLDDDFDFDLDDL